jgi:phosphoribosylformylglycinamidine synthase
VDLTEEIDNAALIRRLVQKGLVNAVHDVSDGGLACALSEVALASGEGLSIDIGDRFGDMSLLALLFGEGAARYVVVAKGSEEPIFDLIEAEGDKVKSLYLGHVQETGDPHISFVHDARSDKATELSLSKLRDAHEGWLPRYMKGE